jgi:peptide/nickel transport system ATP-binding protein
MLFITHNLALVRSIAQHAVVLRHGAVVESGPVEQVLEHPADPYTARLMADVPRLWLGATRRSREWPMRAR